MVSPEEATCVRILHHTALLIALVDPLWLDDLVFWVSQVLVQSVDLACFAAVFIRLVNRPSLEAFTELTDHVFHVGVGSVQVIISMGW